MAQQPTIDSVLKEKEFEEGDKQDKCPICLAEFQPKETICVLPCQHSYHRACIEQWLRERSPSPSCPFCRHNVLGGAQAAASQPEVAEPLQAVRNRLLHFQSLRFQPYMALAILRSRSARSGQYYQ